MEQKPNSLDEIFPCWEKLTDVEKERLHQAVEQKQFQKGQTLHRGEEDCAGLFLVRAGRLRAFILSAGGKEVTLYHLLPWDICLFSAACIMQNIQFAVHVEAEEDTEVFVVPADIYDALMKTSLPISEYTNQLLAARFSDVMWKMEQILFTGFDSRLASLLLEKSEMENTTVLYVTHDALARHLGSAREVVTRMLKYFSEEGLVQLSRGKVILLQPKKLQGLIDTP